MDSPTTPEDPAQKQEEQQVLNEKRKIKLPKNTLLQGRRRGVARRERVQHLALVADQFVEVAPEGEGGHLPLQEQDLERFGRAEHRLPMRLRNPDALLTGMNFGDCSGM